MKKGFVKILTAGLVLSASAGLVGCTIKESDNDDIKYSFYNYDNTYIINETFSLSGAKLKITNKDGSETEITITDDMIKSLPDMSTVGTKTITIVYDGNEFTLTIEVLEASVINHEITGYETSYYTDDVFDLSNLRLKLFYDNGTDETKNVTSSMIEQMPDMSTAGTKTIAILYSGESYSFTISVVEPSITGYTVTGYEQSYFTSDEFTLDNVKLNLSYNNNSQKTIDITPSMIEEMPDMTTAGTKTILVNYQGRQYQFTINVVAPSQVDYVISGYQNSYFTTSTFTTNGLKLKVFYNDDSEKEIDITESMIQQMPVMTTAGTKTIVVNYNQKQYTFTISVVEPVVLSYTITGYADSYFTSATFATNGLKLNLVYNDGNDESIDIVPSMIKQVPNMTIPGNKTVVVIYGEDEYQFTIKVVIPRETGRQVVGYKSLYDINTEFELSEIQIKVNYEDSTHKFVDVTESMIEQMPDMTTEGIKNVVVIYNGQSTQISFEVKDIAKAEMMEKIQNFMNDYNSADVKTSGIKINVEGTAKYLEDNVEFNEELYNITMSSLNNLDGYKIYQPDVEAPYVLIKEFDSIEELENDFTWIDLVGVNYVVLDMYDGDVRRWYGTSNSYVITDNMPEISLDEFMDNALKITQRYSDEGKDITVFNSVFAQPIYKAITNAIVNSTMNIQKGDIILAKDNFTAKLDIVKTLNNISTNVANVDFYDMFINDMLLTESDSTYVELARTYIAEMFEITDQNTLDELDYALTKDIRKIRNNQLQDLETTYNMIVELNNIIQESDGNSSLLEKLNIIVSGIDSQDKHMLSKFVYSCKDFVTIEKRIYGESEDYDYIHYTLNGIVYGYNGGVYMYYYDQEVDKPEMIESYYSGLKSLVEKFENIKDYTSIKTFANDIIADLRTMDAVNQEMEENEYISAFLNIGVTSSVRMAIEYYIEMYDAEMIADIIDMLALTGPESGELYEVLSDSMAPAMWSGDKVLVETASTYYVGDIIAYNFGNNVIIHRIIEITEDGGEKQYICKGDNNVDADQSSITQDQIIGVVTDVNPIYIGLDENLVNALKDCSDIIYLAFKPNGNIDYVKLIEDLCERLEVEKDYYIEQFNAGNLTIFTDLFDRFVPDWNEGEGAQLEMNTAYRNACLYLDSIFVEGTDRTEFINEINKCLTATLNGFKEFSEGDDPETEMILDCLIKMTNTEQDFYANLQDVVTEYKSTAKEYIRMMLTSVLSLDDENETAMNELDHIINYHLTAYIKDELNMSDVIGDLNSYIDKYCDEETKVYTKTSAVLGIILMGQEEDIDYNELFAGIELPNEIEEVDFNKLIKEMLKDKNTYDILSLNDVKVDYITDAQGNIIKEVLTVSLKANYDILLSSLDANVTLTIEINF